MTAAIEIEGLVKRFGRQTALDGINLELAPGERLALLGHNGAGKTTLIRLILGLAPADAGRIRVQGGAPGSDMNRQTVAYLPENVAFHGALTGAEQLRLYARLKGEPASVVAGLVERVGLGDAARRRISTYSKGMRQRVGLAQLLLGRPRLVILDEPTSGLDPLSRETFYQMISELAEDGAAVLLSSHALTEIEARTDRIAILRSGKLVADDRLRALAGRAGLPIRLRVQAEPGRAEEVAKRIGGRRINGQSVELSCTTDEKVRLLAEITALGAAVVDIDMLMPSLEDIYRHYSREPERETG